MVITVSPRHDWLQIEFDLPYLKLGPWLSGFSNVPRARQQS